MRTPKLICEVRTAGLIMSLDDSHSIAAMYLDCILTEGWNIEVVKQNRGYCHIGHRLITIPAWAYDKGPDYLNYYLSHELAHAKHYRNYPDYAKHAVHGEEFMKCFKSICEPRNWHFELEYKPQNAAKAGIMVIPEDF